MKKSFLLLISFFTSISAFANPFSLSNFYTDGFGGFNYINSHRENDMRVDLDPGFVVGASLGYRISRFFRAEGEVAYRANTFNQLVIQGMQFPAEGSVRKVTLMANGLVDLPFFESILIPYFGFGLGERWDNESFRLEPVTTTEGTYYFNKLISKGRGFAYQGIAGLTFWSGKKMQTAVEYRYLNGSHIQANNTLNLKLTRFF